MIEQILQADRLLNVDQVVQARDMYARVAELDPGNAIAVVGLARCALADGDDAKAYELAARALDIDPENDMARRMEARLAEVLAARGEAVARAGGGATPGGGHLRPLVTDAPAASLSSCRHGQHRGGDLHAGSTSLPPRPAARPLMRLLVTGGAGYIGSVSVEQMVLAGHDVVVLDTLATGHREAVAPGALLSVHSVRDKDAVVALLRQHRIEAVLHCAARSLVSQSMLDPGLYYAENVVGGIALLDALREAGVDRLVFSSTAAVYGEPEKVPIRENAPAEPVNPYGATKLAFEGAMKWYSAYGLRSVSLRYFNVAGASEHYGERHDPETHLIPNVLRAARGGPPLTIFGDDYPTADGTAIRDYIHVLDLADAHIEALELTAQMEPGQEDPQPRLRQRLLRQAGARCRESAGGQAHPAQLRTASRWRPSRAGGFLRSSPQAARLGARTRHAGGDDRLGLAAPGASPGSLRSDG